MDRKKDVLYSQSPLEGKTALTFPPHFWGVNRGIHCH